MKTYMLTIAIPDITSWTDAQHIQNAAAMLSTVARSNPAEINSMEVDDSVTVNGNENHVLARHE